VRLKVIYGFLTFLIVVSLFFSCASFPSRPYVDKTPVNKSSYLSPQNSVIVFGSAEMAQTALDVFGPPTIRSMTYIQINPESNPLVISPGRSGTFFFTHPLPIGSSLKLIFFLAAKGKEVTYFYRGVQGKGGADCKLTEPGLLYLGSLQYCDKPFLEGNKKAFRETDNYTLDFYPVGNKKEIDALKAILPYYTKTPWESVINDRIKELQK
jgi:hypothetical protein